ncbi:HesA/MoeB/ThiF family protein [Hyphobacterium marinum]|uniref:HesA/MoeB/ThiF family protein n=1 Tax=Hyphobacterium marinum TaxID=3116574 RepID=A0ABU7LV82_9PROT|nr:HesA/MoeB/ThiF family protein [Hyphobacterium sp. Y6023]MEE2565474.1 HesA/MoeB/ThiF family protein [Hyphobacterium sp. Y6023]
MNFSDDDIARYARHLVLKEIGGPGQQALRSAKVFIVGAGGLGSPAALYLAAAGVGQIILADPDTVSLDNLQRQILFRTADVGTRKAETGKTSLEALNPGVTITALTEAVTGDNAARLFAGHDLVIDGTDSFETRFAVNAGCHDAGIALLSGAVGRWDGQVALFTSGPTKQRPRGERGPCYRCLVPVLPPDAETCARVGVVGALTGVVGSMLALEAIKVITGAGRDLSGRLMMYDGLDAEARTVRLNADPDCPVCGG